MGVLLIVLVMAFSTTLCITEIPKMRKNKEYKELAAFLILLLCGTALAALQSLNIKIPNPSDFVAAVFAPVVELMKGVLE